MTGDTKRGTAVGDRWSDEFAKHRRDFDVAAERLKVRAELKSAHEDEPDTGVIQLAAEQRVALRAEQAKSEPPKSPGALVIVYSAVKDMPPWGKVLVAMAAIAAYVALRLKGAVP